MVWEKKSSWKNNKNHQKKEFYKLILIKSGVGIFEICDSNQLFRHEMLDDKTEILYIGSVYSPILNSRTKKILWPAGDLQMGQIVLVED